MSLKSTPSLRSRFPDRYQFIASVPYAVSSPRLKSNHGKTVSLICPQVPSHRFKTLLSLKLLSPSLSSFSFSLKASSLKHLVSSLKLLVSLVSLKLLPKRGCFIPSFILFRRISLIISLSRFMYVSSIRGRSLKKYGPVGTPMIVVREGIDQMDTFNIR